MAELRAVWTDAEKRNFTANVMDGALFAFGAVESAPR